MTGGRTPRRRRPRHRPARPHGPVGPVTARRMRRAALVYAIVWVLGILPAALGAAPGLSAFGLGLVLPGGGFLFAGSEVLAVLALLAFVVSLFVWWAAGPVVLPPIVWAVGAGLAGLTVDGAGTADAA